MHGLQRATPPSPTSPSLYSIASALMAGGLLRWLWFKKRPARSTSDSARPHHETLAMGVSPFDGPCPDVLTGTLVGRATAAKHCIVPEIIPSTAEFPSSTNSRDEQPLDDHLLPARPTMASTGQQERPEASPGEAVISISTTTAMDVASDEVVSRTRPTSAHTAISVVTQLHADDSRSIRATRIERRECIIPGSSIMLTVYAVVTETSELVKNFGDTLKVKSDVTVIISNSANALKVDPAFMKALDDIARLHPFVSGKLHALRGICIR